MKPIRLVRFVKSGASEKNMTNLIVATDVLSDVSWGVFAVKVVYDPSTQDWELWGTESVARLEKFDDTALKLIGNTTDSTFTSEPMKRMGLIFTYGREPQTFRLGDLSLEVSAAP
jgi:hypothetical protein